MARLRGVESRRRRREFVRLFAAGVSVEDAVALSRLDPRRLPSLFDEPTFRAVAAAVFASEATPVAVVAIAPVASQTA